jgi:hypothetical protein
LFGCRAPNRRARNIFCTDLENKTIPIAIAAKANSEYETSVKRQNGIQSIPIATSQVGNSAATGASEVMAAIST